MALPKKFRLRGKDDFQRIKKEGRIMQFRYFGLAFLSRKDVFNSRFGFIISTKISTRAHERNKIRRTISHEIENLLEKAKVGYDVVFLVKSSILKVDKGIIKNEVKKALIDSGII